MTVTVLLFASLAEAAGTRRVIVPHLQGDTVRAVVERLLADYTTLRRFVPNLLYALDEEYVDDDATPVPPGSTLALIPPVSGG
jgi:molybdopterin synthase catalytic subunit